MRNGAQNRDGMLDKRDIAGGIWEPQRSNAPRVRNMSRFNGGKLPGNLKYFFKKSKDKAVPGKGRFKL